MASKGILEKGAKKRNAFQHKKRKVVVTGKDKKLKEMDLGIVTLVPTYGLSFLSPRRGINNVSPSLGPLFNNILFYEVIILKWNGLLILFIRLLTNH